MAAGLSLAMFVPMAGKAQKDISAGKPSVDIISSYKPVLRNAVKINFSDHSFPQTLPGRFGDYNVPSQNLIYAYQPVTLKPLALEQDSNLYLETGTMLKQDLAVTIPVR